MKDPIKSVILSSGKALYRELASLFKLKSLNVNSNIKVEKIEGGHSVIISITDSNFDNLTEISIIRVSDSLTASITLGVFLDPRMTLEEKIKLSNGDTNFIKDTYSAIHTTYKKRGDSIIMDLSLDLETTGFNKPFSNGGGYTHGAAVHGILQIGAIVNNPKHNGHSGIVASYEAMIRIEEGVSEHFTLDNTLFQNSTGFSEAYSQAIEDGMLITLTEAEQAIIKLLKETCADRGAELEPYSYNAPVKFRLVGKSVAFDLDFIQQQMPELSMYISHEILDVSVIKNVFRYANPKFASGLGHSDHFALSDAKLALDELKLYRELFSKLIKKSDVENATELNTWLDKHL